MSIDQYLDSKEIASIEDMQKALTDYYYLNVRLPDTERLQIFERFIEDLAVANANNDVAAEIVLVNNATDWYNAVEARKSGVDLEASTINVNKALLNLRNVNYESQLESED